MSKLKIYLLRFILRTEKFLVSIDALLLSHSICPYRDLGFIQKFPRERQTFCFLLLDAMDKFCYPSEENVNEGLIPKRKKKKPKRNCLP